MGFLKNTIKAGLLAKAIDLARRPENQAKVKELIAKARSKKPASR